MMIDSIKQIVYDNFEVHHKFRFNGARNQIEEFSGKISQIYSYVFLITLDNGIVRSFSFTDILINNLEIIE